jgi:hypothetical protein
MADPRARYFNRVKRLRRSARRWSVVAGSLVFATAVLLPYAGVGLPDVFWAAAAGGTSALAFWRWSDLRALTAQPAPPELDPVQRAAQNQQRIEAVIGKVPIGRTALTELHRVRHLSRVRNSAIAPAATRLDRAMKTFAALAPRLTGPAREVLGEATGAEAALRDLAERIASVERAMKLPQPHGSDQLTVAHTDLQDRFTTGVTAYEGMVSAAAGYVAEDGRLGEPNAINRLIEAGDRLRGIADGMADLRMTEPPSAFA